MSYKAPIKDMLFVMNELAGLEEISTLPGCEDATPETVEAILEENGLIVQLYSVGRIYGELYYDPLANKILRWRAFEGTQQLAPYLAHIRFNAR